MENLKKHFRLYSFGLSIIVITSCNSQGPKTGGPCDYESFSDRFRVVGVDTTDSYYLFEFSQINAPDFRLTLNHLELKSFLDLQNVNELTAIVGDTLIVSGEQITKGTCTPLIVTNVTTSSEEQ
jgi:hypothetical protein